MKLRYFILRRLLVLIPTLIGLTLFTFALLYILEIKNLQLILSQYLNPHNPSSQAALNYAKQQLGIGEPFPERYAIFLKNLFTGTWGYFPNNFPTFAGQPVLTGIAESFPNTVQLAVLATLASILISIPLGTYIGARPNSLGDTTGRVFSLLGYAMPVFFLGVILQMVFASGGIVAGWTGHGLPVGGSFPTTHTLPGFINPNNSVSSPTHIMMLDALLNGYFYFFYQSFLFVILPVATITYAVLASLLRFIRSGMVDSLNQEYVKTARAKGVPENMVIKHHVRRNAMIPAVTVMGLLFAGLLGGVLVVEYMFSYPGLGLLAYHAVFDFAVYGVLGTTFFFGLILVLANLSVDVIYALLDPRIRY